MYCAFYRFGYGFHDSSDNEIYYFDKIPFCLPYGKATPKADKPMIPHSLRLDSCGVCVAKDSQSVKALWRTASPLDALDPRHPRLSLK
jgi:hypothetical protein